MSINMQFGVFVFVSRIQISMCSVRGMLDASKTTITTFNIPKSMKKTGRKQKIKNKMMENEFI